MSPSESPDPLNRSAQPASDRELPALPPELLQLEGALRGLAPREDRLDRDRLLFEAGREQSFGKQATQRERHHQQDTRQSRGWFWPAATAAMTTVAASLALALALSNEVRIVERVKIVEVDRIVEPVPGPELEPSLERVEPPRVAEKESTLPRSSQDSQELAWSWEPHADAQIRGDLVPRAGMDFRLFEHLLGETTTAGTGNEAAEPTVDDEKVLSPRSLPRLLNRSA